MLYGFLDDKDVDLDSVIGFASEACPLVGRGTVDGTGGAPPIVVDMVDVKRGSGGGDETTRRVVQDHDQGREVISEDSGGGS